MSADPEFKVYVAQESIGGHVVFDQDVFELRDNREITSLQAAVIIRLLRFCRPITAGATMISKPAAIEYLANNATMIIDELPIPKEVRDLYIGDTYGRKGRFDSTKEFDDFVCSLPDKYSNAKIARMVGVSADTIRNVRIKFKRGKYRDK